MPFTGSRGQICRLAKFGRDGGFASTAIELARPTSPRIGIALTWLVLSLAGCQAEEKFEEDPVKANLRQINKAYWAHLGWHQSPPKPDDLRACVQDLHDVGLGAPAEEALVSPRDKQPFVIIYGAGDTESGDGILAYEAQGAEGTRWVVTMAQDIMELTNEEFKKARFVKNHKPKGI